MAAEEGDYKKDKSSDNLYFCFLSNTCKINFTCGETTVVVSNTAGVDGVPGVVGAGPGVAGCCELL